MIKTVLLVILAEILTSVGQILFKKSANSLEPKGLPGFKTQFYFIKDILARPLIWVGIFFMGLNLVVWVLALSTGPLSLVFSIGSLQYVIILFLAHFLLDEKIDRMKVIGTFLVVFGIALITIS